MVLSARQLNRSTLARQLLDERTPLPARDALQQVLALQAQEPASPYVALWNRIADFDPAELDRAFADRVVVKAPLMRITLHAVDVDDYHLLHEAATPVLRGARLNDKRFRVTGMAIDDADGLIPGLVDFTSIPRSKDEIVAHLTAADARAGHKGAWWALRTYAPLWHSPAEPPWSFGRRPVFEAASIGDRPDRGAALARFVVRYLRAFGPATPHDAAQFSLRRVSEVKAALTGLDDEVTRTEGPDGVELFDVVDAPAIPDEDHAAPPRLLGMWDSVLLAYADRRRIIPEPYRSHVIRRNGDTLPTVLVDGLVAGVWRVVEQGVEVTPFEPLDPSTWSALEGEAVMLGRLLAERDPLVYGRFRRWWDKLPSDGRRTLPIA